MGPSRRFARRSGSGATRRLCPGRSPALSRISSSRKPSRHAKRAGASHDRLRLARGPGRRLEEVQTQEGRGVLWWRLSQALDKTRFFARDARFGEDERAAFGIVWQEDLFAEGDEDNRFTVDGEAFMSAQRAWLDAHMPKNGVLLDVDEYGREKLPPKAQPTWTKPKKGDKIGFAIRPRDGAIHEVVFRMPEPEAKKGKDRSNPNDQDEAPTPKKTRPEITHKGDEIIGALRTEALVKLSK